ncbi:VIT1/CCC1 transporter family protein [Catellatospora sp. NPDC049111]|uniref:VIT1/CCC1 transporter family protein n=1 Tax=Catellatospora sp. NPDC049111 TaxID=3155271 RepID=UPI003405A721
MVFTAGSLLPLAAILLPPADIRIPVTFAVVLASLALTGVVSGRLGSSPVRRAVARLVVGGSLAMAVTYALRHLVGVAAG